jgi:hypothetical protein
MRAAADGAELHVFAMGPHGQVYRVIDIDREWPRQAFGIPDIDNIPHPVTSPGPDTEGWLLFVKISEWQEWLIAQKHEIHLSGTGTPGGPMASELVKNEHRCRIAVVDEPPGTEPERELLKGFGRPDEPTVDIQASTSAQGASQVQSEAPPPTAQADEPTDAASAQAMPEAQPKDDLPVVEQPRRGAPTEYDWHDGVQFLEQLWGKRGDPKKPKNWAKDWRSNADAVRAVMQYLSDEETGKEPDFKHAEKTLRSEIKRLRAGQKREE